MASRERALELRACAIQFSSKVVKTQSRSQSPRVLWSASRHVALTKGHVGSGNEIGKNLSLVEDCSKSYRITYDEIFRVDLLGGIKIRVHCKTDFELFLISHSFSLQNNCLSDVYFPLHEC